MKASGYAQHNQSLCIGYYKNSLIFANGKKSDNQFTLLINQNPQAYINLKANSTKTDTDVCSVTCKLTNAHSTPQMIQVRAYTFKTFLKSRKQKIKAFHDILLFFLKISVTKTNFYDE